MSDFSSSPVQPAPNFVAVASELHSNQFPEAKAKKSSWFKPVLKTVATLLILAATFFAGGVTYELTRDKSSPYIQDNAGFSMSLEKAWNLAFKMHDPYQRKTEEAVIYGYLSGVVDSALATSLMCLQGSEDLVWKDVHKYTRGTLHDLHWENADLAENLSAAAPILRKLSEKYPCLDASTPQSTH